MFAISLGIAVAQYVYADTYGIVLKDINGQPLKSIVLQITNLGTLNNLAGQANSINSTNIATNTISVASAIAGLSVTMIELISGVYVFDILYHLGVPNIFVVGMVAIYVALIGRAILGWIKGVF